MLLVSGLLVLSAHLLLRGGAASTAAKATAAGPVAQAASVGAESEFRAVSAAATAYFADNGSYDGMTAAALRSSYDGALPGDVIVAAAAGSGFCLQAIVEGTTYSEHGPGGAVSPAPC